MENFNEALIFMVLIGALFLIFFIIARYTYLIRMEMIKQGIYLDNRSVKNKYLDVGCIAFGLGIGLLIGIPASAAICLGGLLKLAVTGYYVAGKTDEARKEAGELASNDTMLAGASVFAAGAVLSILIVLAKTALDALGWEWFDIAH